MLLKHKYGIALIAGLAIAYPVVAHLAGGSLGPSPPEFEAQTAPNENPYSLHFSLRNTSAVFALKGVTLACEMPRFVTQAATSVNLKAPPASNPVVVQPLETIHYQCPLNRNVRVGASPVVYSTTIVAVRFSTLGISRTLKSEPFYWTAEKRQWARGTLE